MDRAVNILWCDVPYRGCVGRCVCKGVVLMLCYICGRSDFKSFEHFKMHHKNVHNVFHLGQENKSREIPTMPLVSLLPSEKKDIVIKLENKLREKAWTEGKLNPLVGEDRITKEPVWNYNREVLE